METITILLLAFSALFLGVIGYRGYKMRILLKMGLRNVSRRKVNTLIVILGLMIGTTIISSSLVIGDTLENMYTKEVYDDYDETDEVVFTYDRSGGLMFLDYSEYHELNTYIENSTTLSEKVEDVSPEINYRVSVFDHNTKLSESETTLIAFDHSESTGFGKLHPVSDSQGSGGFGDPVGSSVTCEELLEGEIYVNEKLANEIDAEQGDKLEIFYGENLSRTFTVKAIVEAEGR